MLDILHQVGLTLNGFLHSPAEKVSVLAISILLIVGSPLLVLRAVQARKQGQIYTFRQGLWLSLMILFVGTSDFLKHLPWGSLHLIGDLIGMFNIIPLIFMLSYMAKAKCEQVEAQAAKRAKAAERLISPAESWPPAPAAK